MKPGAYSLRKINKIDKPLARLSRKKKKEGLKITKERRHNNHHLRNTIMREYHEKLYANKLRNLEEIDKFLERYKIQKEKKN